MRRSTQVITGQVHSTNAGVSRKAYCISFYFVLLRKRFSGPIRAQGGHSAVVRAMVIWAAGPRFESCCAHVCVTHSSGYHFWNVMSIPLWTEIASLFHGGCHRLRACDAQLMVWSNIRIFEYSKIQHTNTQYSNTQCSNIQYSNIQFSNIRIFKYWTFFNIRIFNRMLNVRIFNSRI